MDWPEWPGLKQVDSLHLLDQRTQKHSVAIRVAESCTETVDDVVKRKAGIYKKAYELSMLTGNLTHIFIEDRESDKFWNFSPSKERFYPDYANLLDEDSVGSLVLSTKVGNDTNRTFSKNQMSVDRATQTVDLTQIMEPIKEVQWHDDIATIADNHRLPSSWALDCIGQPLDSAYYEINSSPQDLGCESGYNYFLPPELTDSFPPPLFKELLLAGDALPPLSPTPSYLLDGLGFDPVHSSHLLLHSNDFTPDIS